jgi:hypothetical protein
MENQMQLIKIICMNIMHQMGSLHFHPHTKPIFLKIAKNFCFVKDNHQEIAMISSFVDEGQHEI